jgi:septal ring factor EnvC (AmiA/AmiB activator)
MSKTIDNLKKLQHLRANGNAAPASGPTPERPNMQPKQATPSNQSGRNIFLTLLLVIFLLGLAGLNVKLFLIMRNFTAETSVTSEKLNKLEKIIINNLRDINDISTNVAQVTKQVANIEQQLAAQTTAMDNLTKAKNVLFSKMKSLEVGLDKLQRSNTKNQ